MSPVDVADEGPTTEQSSYLSAPLEGLEEETEEETWAHLDELLSYFYEGNEEGEEDTEVIDTDDIVDVLAEAEAEEHDTYGSQGIATTNDAISLYLNELGRVSLLKAEEEVALAKLVEIGRKAQQRLKETEDAEERGKLQRLVEEGAEARQHFIEANTRLVVNIAKKYRGYSMPFMDLVQAGNIGLIKAVDRFDYRMGNKFSTYATWWIRQAILRALSQHGRIIRLPVHVNEQIRKVHKASQNLEQKLGHKPTPQEIAEAMNLKTSQIRRLLRVMERPISINQTVGEQEDSELVSFIEDENTPSPSQRVEQQLLREDLEEIMEAALSKKEQKVLYLRLGLYGNEPHTLAEVAEVFDVSRERIRQIERKALRKLRSPYYGRKLRSYLERQR